MALPTDPAELVSSRMNETNLMAAECFSLFILQRREFTPRDGDLVYFNNTDNLMWKFSIEYKVDEWRPFIDSPMIFNKKFFCIMYTIWFWIRLHMRESYKNLELVLKKFNMKIMTNWFVETLLGTFYVNRMDVLSNDDSWANKTFVQKPTLGT